MLLLSEDQTRNALPYPDLIDALAEMFRSGCTMPTRHHHDFKIPGEPDGTMLLMPAWVPGGYAGVKVVNVVPGNSERNLPAVHGQYLLSDARTGEMLAMIDGGELTARRTAAASALAARYLARSDARHLLVLGTGRLAPNLIAAHMAIRSIEEVTIWGRSQEKTAQFARDLDGQLPIRIQAASSLRDALGLADIVSAATLSTEPLIKGDLLKPGAHVDLVGAFKPTMRESDDDLIERAEIYVDTRDGCLSEGGDIVQPLKSGLITPGDIKADLYELCRGEHPGRQSDATITMFKSVGAALEDLAGATLAYQNVEH
ncbi:ornithine cyclodeaminase [Labrenzia sp. EL_208]|uniref:Ornithine cyclodeaminase n=1 Tax=Roseibium album TaxID=311410 RepID=A0A0M7AVI2_9HYPH|nr:ornithine cyclodeaminase family protein [Roseibium album]MBG6148286.1 ornithine cyclodeaminase [Labrenzia sp. EL_142]MBG6155954.1 ornithine cyclodeaminase [Labrenzia sp. EL_162]MBG6161411.1 ornithine cyclodeaminase [Labrenzia sp. EL_195]MBG6177046.1 ornithine cyclodeaminase [Labrenzia sp. EL_132]MBG6194488.1 ornithine cyclodeaminase [Labrenzia sp. EL_159]MBG6200579.1 ornithine cyclodeaminase [Labrenzia sp. EL_13]MBG6231675.1 ornithine cyclodeaminase [Labrenzia sp. EL_208]